MSTAIWVLVALVAIGTIVSGLLRMRTWLAKPAPPEVIEAARRAEEEEKDE